MSVLLDEVHVEVEETPTVETVRKVWAAFLAAPATSAKIEKAVTQSIALALTAARNGEKHVNVEGAIQHFTFGEFELYRAEMERRGFTTCIRDHNTAIKGWAE